MPTPQERLATALEAMRDIQDQGRNVIRTRDLSRDARELLVASKFLQPIIGGWYVPSRPDGDGESTAWYASYWEFVREYLNDRFGDAWVLGPDHSLLLHAGQWNVPRQLVVRSPSGGGRPTALPFETSIYDLRLELPPTEDMTTLDGLRIYGLEAALIKAGTGIFQTAPVEMRAVLTVQGNLSSLLARLLDGGHTTVAGRLAGAFRNVGRDRDADEILSAMKAAGYKPREQDPFAARLEGLNLSRVSSPSSQRIKMMWAQMRGIISEIFPAPPRRNDLESYMREVEGIYVTDAYHSLSIEGYRVTPEMIERVRSGAWNPDGDADDRQPRDAMAARGYWEAFQLVKDSVQAVLRGQNAGEVADRDHSSWYRALFQPSVAVGLLKAASLAGYRNHPVYIRGSRHVPLHHEVVRDVMPTFFELLTAETDPAVRIVLGHFIFVYIHPYMDGNGRTARFLMNVMMAAGGYPWTVIPIGDRDQYMAALETASVDGDIRPFAEFLGELVRRAPPKIAS